MRKTKYMFSIYAGATPDSKNPKYWDGDIIWITPADYKTTDKYVLHGTKNLTEAGYAASNTTIVPAGSIIVSKRAPIGTVSIAGVPLCTNQGCLSCVPNEDVDSTFAYYALSIMKDKMEVLGAGTTFKEISANAFSNMKIPYFPLPEQRAIVNYLDPKCSAIDEAIGRHKKIIEKLEEYRRAEIARLISFNVESDTYETGNVWFPTLPSEISISRVGMHFNITLGKMLCPMQRDANDTLERYYCAGDIHFDGINQENLKEMWFSPNEKRLYEVSNGDLLIVEGGAGAGNAFIVHGQEEKVYIQNSVLRVRGSSTGSVRYLRYLIEYLVKNGYIAYACNTSTFSHFTKDKVSGTPFPVASFELQEKVADQIDSMDVIVRSAQRKHEAIILKLEEYRKSIIYNAVTGKIDCRTEAME